MIRNLINQRTEKAQAEMEMRSNEIKNLRRVKRRLFKKANTKTKDILMKQEELESREREVMARAVYIQAVNDILDIIKWLLTKV